MTFSERILLFFLIKLFYIYLDLVKGKLNILKMDVLVKIAQYINMDTTHNTLLYITINVQFVLISDMRMNKKDN